MSTEQLQAIRRQLEDALIAAGSNAAPGRGANSGDVCERALVEMESALAVETANVKWRTTKDVQSALRRLETAAYGVCQSCGEPIGTRRLRALPWASRCIRCQSAAEIASQSGREPQRLWDEFSDPFYGEIQ